MIDRVEYGCIDLMNRKFNILLQRVLIII